MPFVQGLDSQFDVSNLMSKRQACEVREGRDVSEGVSSFSSKSGLALSSEDNEVKS